MGNPLSQPSWGAFHGRAETSSGLSVAQPPSPQAKQAKPSKTIQRIRFILVKEEKRGSSQSESHNNLVTFHDFCLLPVWKDVGDGLTLLNAEDLNLGH